MEFLPSDRFTNVSLSCWQLLVSQPVPLDLIAFDFVRQLVKKYCRTSGGSAYSDSVIVSDTGILKSLP